MYVKQITFIIILFCYFLTVTVVRADDLSSGVMIAHFIDMGQSDATLLEFSCGAVLIDAGAQYKQGNNAATVEYNQTQIYKLISYLTEFFNSRPDLNKTLDAIYVTHNHIDHTHALREIAEAFSVTNYVGTGQETGLAEAVEDPKWIRKQNGINKNIITSNIFTDDTFPDGISTDITDPINCGNINPKISILSGHQETNPGWTQKEFKNLNNHSLVIRVDFGESSFLFTGDLEEDGIEYLIHRYESALSFLDVDVYQVGHHGSHNATNAKLLEVITPEIAVISVGKWNYGKPNTPFTTYTYGHPRLIVIELLALSIHGKREPKKVKIFTRPKKDRTYIIEDMVYSTSWDGTIKIKATYDGMYTVETEQ